MPKYKFALKNGKTLALEGDEQPSDADVESIAKEQGLELQPVNATPISNEISKTPNINQSNNEGILSKVWKGISEPLTNAPSRFSNQVANTIDPGGSSNGSEIDLNTFKDIGSNLINQPGATIKGFGAGAIQGIGNLVSGATSPLNLALMAATGGESAALKAGLPGVARAARIGSQVASAPVVAHGASELISPESSMSQRGKGLTEIAGGLLGMKGPSLESNIPKSIDLTKTPDIFGHIPDVMGKTLMTGERVRDMFKMEPKEALSKGLIELDDSQGFTGYRTVQPKPSLPIGSKILIKAEKSTPETIKKAQEQGYEFQGINDRGHFRFTKTSEGVAAPILESEVGTTRPRMGPDVDQPKTSVMGEIGNFPRAMMASIDMSGPLRQGIGLIHKPGFWKALPGMFKAWGSSEAFDAIQKSISEKPLFKERLGPNGKTLPSFAQDAGLQLTDVHGMAPREESFMSNLANKIPGVPASNRAYVGFLNKLRADTFESLVNQGKIFGSDGETNIPLARELANFVNTATGRGSLGKLETSAKALNSVFFAPRLIASRLNILNPMYYTMASPMVRQEALKSLFAIAGTGMAVGQLSKMAGGKVESDPTSSDFGKIRIGDTRIDPFAGFQQYIVAANRLVQGKTKSSTTGNSYNLGEKFGRQTRLDVMERFAESKLNPALSFAVGLARGKDFTGQPFNIPEEMVQRVVPLFLQDLKQLVTENPDLIPGIHNKSPYDQFHPENLPMAIPSFFGAGVQQYGGR